MEIDNKGLTEKEAKERLIEHGPNELPEKPPPTSIELIIEQVKSPLVYVLVAAGVVTLFLGDYADSAIIFFVVVVNSALGFYQEKKASNALESLKAMVHPTVDVIRDGKEKNIKIEGVVPGDIIELEQGDKVPADGKLIHSNRFMVEEAVLTGESVPVKKKVGDQVFMGTIVSTGIAYMEVEKTGEQTQMGKIAETVQQPDEDTPLTKQMKVFSQQLTILVVVLTVVVFTIGFFTDRGIVEMFKTSVALAVSSIPEGLLIALTVVLTVGMQRILKKKGLVRNLVSAETLGGVTTICVDKTGTLTYGKLKVQEVIGSVDEMCTQHFASSEDPIMTETHEWLQENSTHFEDIEEDFKKDCSLIDSIPFTPKNRYFASLIEHKNGDREMFVNGAPELLLDLTDLPDSEIKEFHDRIEKLTEEGKRVIGTARKDLPDDATKISEKQVQQGGLRWIGLVVFTDPVRKGIIDSFKQTKKAGIKTIVITGDYADTAQAVMAELEMKVDDTRTFLGDDVQKLNVTQLAKKLKEINKLDEGPILFARTKPEQKMKVINALKENSEVVAMMGDGVNDAPALHRADIGIVVGEATDVAKESADLVLLDSSFKTIVEAIREGRGIFDNIRKIILYLMSDAFAEIVAVIVAMIAALPLPITAAQILWINLVSDGFPYMALTVDSKSKTLMERAPRSPKENLVTNWMKVIIMIVSVVGGLIALGLFYFFYRTTDNLVLAQSVAFATLGANSLIYVFSVKTLKAAFWHENVFSNKWLNLAVIGGFALTIMPFEFQLTRTFLNLYPLNMNHWIMILISSISMFFVVEMLKAISRIHIYHRVK